MRANHQTHEICGLGLREGRVIYAFAKSESDRLPTADEDVGEPHFSWEYLNTRLLDKLDSTTGSPAELVELRLGAARAFTRFESSRSLQTSITILVDGELNGSADTEKLLSLLTTELECTLYDQGWRNRIHLDDPYYRFSAKTKNVLQPRNFRQPSA